MERPLVSDQKRVFMHTRKAFRTGLLLTFVCGIAPQTLVKALADTSNLDGDSAHVQAFDLPQSVYLSEETRSVLRQHHALWAAAFNSSCGSLQGANLAGLAKIRECQAAAFYTSEIYRQVRDRYPVSIASQRIGGVYTEIFTPSRGIGRQNQKRVLINLHGGGFLEGSRTVSHLESIPIAAVAQIKVVSVDYRQAPEARFPAASEDVVAVYRELVTGTRDHAMSAVVYTHSRLSQLGVETDLHVFEGLGHAFFYDPALPESRAVYALVSKFFDAHLGTE
jgi:acetyl esterase/lipase